MPLGGLFSDSIHVARIVAAALPPGIKLVVKEHANQFNHKYLMPKGRSTDFYARLGEIPNLHCAPLEQPSFELIGGSSAVATISGTSGWEALQLGRPAIVFGHPWYLRAPGVFSVDGPDDVRKVLERVVRGDALVDAQLLARYERAMRERYTKKLIYSTEFLAYAKMTQREHDQAWADIIARHLGAQCGEAAA